MDQSTVLNLCSGYVAIAQQLFGLIAKAKSLRIQLDALGLTKPFNAPGGTGEGPALAAVPFPLPGELSHIKTTGDLVQAVAALESLENALASVVTIDGVQFLPVSALAKLNRGVIG